MTDKLSSVSCRQPRRVSLVCHDIPTLHLLRLPDSLLVAREIIRWREVVSLNISWRNNYECDKWIALEPNDKTRFLTLFDRHNQVT